MHLRFGLTLQITDDFIAAYQAQYGVQEFSDAANDTVGAVASTGAVAMPTEVSSVFQRCRCYHCAFSGTLLRSGNVSECVSCAYSYEVCFGCAYR